MIAATFSATLHRGKYLEELESAPLPSFPYLDAMSTSLLFDALRKHNLDQVSFSTLYILFIRVIERVILSLP